jgi:hypothetical protein
MDENIEEEESNRNTEKSNKFEPENNKDLNGIEDISENKNINENENENINDMSLREKEKEIEVKNSLLTKSQKQNYTDKLISNDYNIHKVSESGSGSRSRSRSGSGDNSIENENNFDKDNDNDNEKYNNNNNLKSIDESLILKSPFFKEKIFIDDKNKLNNNIKKNQNHNQIGNIIDYNIIGNNKIETPEDLVMTLKEAIDDTKKQYKLMRKEYIDEVKKKTEAQQLLQKCIEDLKLEISLSIRDIQNHSKFYSFSFNFNLFYYFF